MRLEPRSDLLRTLAVRIDGTIAEEEPIPLRNTLFAHAHDGLDDAALLRLQVPKGRGFDAMAEKLQLVNTLTGGARGFHVLGSGHGVRKGKLYAATESVVEKVHQHFATAEDALAYGGLLFSEASHVLRLETAKVTSRGDGDGQGWIDADVLREHDLPVRQIQIRALWPNALAKGTLLPLEGLRAREKVDVLFHETQMKGRGKTVSGSYLLAIRDTAQVRTMRSSWTWTQFLDEDLQEELFDRYAKPSLAAVTRAMESNDSALAFLDAIDVEGQEECEKRDLLVSLLASGLSPRHPWLHRRLLELVRRSYLDAALGLGPIPLTSGMACAPDDDRCVHEITCNWLPEQAMVILRYPVRDTQSLRIVKNVHRPDIPSGSIAVHPTLMAQLDGDVDGDWVALCSDRTVARGVRRIHARSTPRLPIPPRTRKRSPIKALPRVAVDAIGATGIGAPTWYVAASVENGRHDLVPRLSLELQVATMALKWRVNRDFELMETVAGELELPGWLELAQDRSVFTQKAPEVPDVGLGHFWNRCSTHFEGETRIARGQLSEFLELVPYPSGDADVLAEVESLRQAFNRRIAQSDGDFDEIRAAISAVKTWSSGKTGELRREYGRTAWYLTHRSQSPKSSGSFAIHAFPDVIAEEVQGTTSYRAPVLADRTIVSSALETVEGRLCRRAVEAPRIDVEVNDAPVTALRLIGGHRILQELYGASEKDALTHLAQCLSGTGPAPHPISLSWVTAPWNGHRVLQARLGDDPIGYVPEDLAEKLSHDLSGVHDAHLMLRGRTVYAALVS